MTIRLIVILLVAAALIAYFYGDKITAWLNAQNNPNPNSKNNEESKGE